MRHVLFVLVVIGCLAVHGALQAKPTVFNQSSPLSAERSGFRWLKVGGFTMDVGLSDASGERAIRSVEIAVDGKISVNGAPAGQVPAGFLTKVQALGTALDDLVGVLARGGKLKI